jgi:hypothetical protein
MLKISCSFDSERFILLKIWSEWVINCFILCHFFIPNHVKYHLSNRSRRCRIALRLRPNDAAPCGSGSATLVCMFPPPLPNTVCIGIPKSKSEFQSRNRNSKVEIGIPKSKSQFRSRNRNSEVEIRIEIPMSKSKPKSEFQCRNRNRNQNSDFDIEIEISVNRNIVISTKLDFNFVEISIASKVKKKRTFVET